MKEHAIEEESELMGNFDYNYVSFSETCSSVIIKNKFISLIKVLILETNQN
jgi:hypothetical protein